MAGFLERVLRLQLRQEGPDFWLLELADGSQVEVFGPENPGNRHLTDCPVVGFLVDDITFATDELSAAGTEIVFGPERSGDGTAWVHFRAPDGNIYELTQRA
jgi:predicted enzyme related to lactoylglutathione lyase